MKNPNGFGSAYKLPGNRRRPWAARITVANVDGHFKHKYLGYYRTQQEALLALAEYNRNPYSIEDRKLTFGELLKRYADEKQLTVRPRTYASIMTVYNNTKPIHNIEIGKVKLDTLQLFFDTCGKSYASMQQMKAMLTTFFTWALKYEYVQKNYASMVNIEKYRSTAVKHEKHVFTPEEIRKVWKAAETDKAAQMVIIMLYTGVRISEMVALKPEDIDLWQKCFYIRQSKTAAGIRTVPIADCIVPFFERFVPYCVTPYTFVRVRFNPLMKSLGLDHTPHETRHTFISMLAEAGVDERFTKQIVGHTGSSITENVYTHISLEPLLDAVNKLPVYCD